MQHSHSQDRSTYLEMFKDSGIVNTIEELNRLDQHEFDELVSVLGSAEFYTPAYQEEEKQQQNQIEKPVVQELGIDEKIKRMRIRPDQKVPVKDYMEQGSSAFEDCLVWYSSNEKPQIPNPF